MVGGLADWFAVTALFRHPLGLPIPHTAIIPTRKDALGRSLESFVASNFLSEPVVKRQGPARPGGGPGRQLARRSGARRPGRSELATATRAAIRVLRDRTSRLCWRRRSCGGSRPCPWGPPAGRLLGQIVEDGTHHRLVDLAVDEAHGWLLANPRRRSSRSSPTRRRAWSPKFLDEAVAGRAYRELLRFVREVQADPAASDAAGAGQPAQPVRRGPAQRPVHDSPRGAAQGAPAQPSRCPRGGRHRSGPPHAGCCSRPSTTRTASCAPRVVGRAQRSGTPARHRRGACRRRSTATWPTRPPTPPAPTAARWRPSSPTRSTAGTAPEASRRIELAVGRDLQFIRINGTVVGALAGLAIHAITVLAG